MTVVTTTDHIIADIITREGGYVDNPSDKGGPTKYGVTLGTLAAWRKASVTSNDVANLTASEASEILTDLYEVKPGFSQLSDDQVRSFMVDWGVNSGPATAIKQLQSLLSGCHADGILGPITAKAANALDPASLLTSLIALRLAFVRRLVAEDPSQRLFLAGWETRIESFGHA